jgi:hypothetical protein
MLKDPTFLSYQLSDLSIAFDDFLLGNSDNPAEISENLSDLSPLGIKVGKLFFHSSIVTMARCIKIEPKHPRLP